MDDNSAAGTVVALHAAVLQYNKTSDGLNDSCVSNESSLGRSS